MARDGKDLIVACDLGATNTRVALAGPKGNIISSTSFPTNLEEGPTGIPKSIARAAVDLLKSNGFPTSRVTTVSIASIGPLNVRRGILVNPPNIPYEEIPLIDVLEYYFDAEFLLLNDCNAAVLGEANLGSAKGHEDVVYVTISTGIGGGAIVNGSLLVGKDGNAVEIGHITIDYSGTLRCGCGARGHWEAYCSGRNLPNFIKLIIENYKESYVDSSLICKISEEGPKNLFHAARQGNRLALKIVEEIGRLNSIGIANVVNAFDPSIVVIGGAIALNNKDLIIDPIRERAPEYYVTKEPIITHAGLADGSPLMGAVIAALIKPKGCEVKR